MQKYVNWRLLSGEDDVGDPWDFALAAGGRRGGGSVSSAPPYAASGIGSGRVNASSPPASDIGSACVDFASALSRRSWASQCLRNVV